MNQKNTQDVHDYVDMVVELDIAGVTNSVQSAKRYIRNLIRVGHPCMDAKGYESFMKYSPSICALTQDFS